MIKNWKTTLAGFAAAALHVTVNGTSLKQWLVALAIAGIGALAKDHNA